MTDRTKQILLSAVVVAGVYVLVEYAVKPHLMRTTGIRIK